jgi:hypothetical protein
LRAVNIGVALGVVAFPASPSAAQPAAAPQVPGLHAPMPGPGQMPPTPAEAMAGYTAVAGWVRAMAVKEAPSAGVVATAASVTLRAGGQVVGRGVAVSRRPEGDEGVLPGAASMAIAEARQRLPVPHDARYEESLGAAAADVTVSVELSGVMAPFSPKDWASATMDVAPGIEGIGVRVGERLEVMFPERMLTTGTEAGAALAALAAKLVGDPGAALKSPGDLSQEHGAVYYRFRTTQVAQTRPRGGPEFLERCGTFVRPREVDTRALEAWASGMAENLWARRWPGPERYGVRGTYDPLLGEFASRSATPAEQALVMEALLRYARHIAKDAAASGRVRDRVATIGADLAALEAGEAPATADPGAAALTWSVLNELGSGGDPMPEPLAALRDGCRASVAKAWADADGLPLPTLLLVLRFAPDVPGLDAEARAARGRGALLKLGPAELPAGMPWIGELSPGNPEGLGAAWTGLRALVHANTLHADALPPDQRDLSGSVLLGPGLPSWQSARPLAFLGEMLRDERFTGPGEMATAVTRQVEGLRFLRQLAADEGETRAYRDPVLAQWGVRNSVWDQRMPPEATALSLIAVTETLESLDAVGARSRPSAGGPGR